MSAQKRKLWSVQHELLIKSREAMLSAVQIFNNPNITFKAESFTVLAIVAWTYLFHSYYKKIKVDYRYFEQGAKRKRYDKTKRGSYKYVDALKRNKSALVISPTHKQGEQVAQAIREKLRARNMLGKKEHKLSRLVNVNFTEAQKADIRSYKAGQCDSV